MPVAVTVEDGTGLADANSYASVIQADAYFATRPRSTSWSPLTSDQKAQYLVHATRILDACCIWNGTALSDEQALAFPRYPSELEAAEIPPVIVVALYELAYQLISTDVTAPAEMNGVSSVKVGPIEIETKSSVSADILTRWIRNLIAPYGTTRGSGNARLIRA
jgi:hypothetical protein